MEPEELLEFLDDLEQELLYGDKATYGIKSKSDLVKAVLNDVRAFAKKTGD